MPHVTADLPVIPGGQATGPVRPVRHRKRAHAGWPALHEYRQKARFLCLLPVFCAFRTEWLLPYPPCGVAAGVNMASLRRAASLSWLCAA